MTSRDDAMTTELCELAVSSILQDQCDLVPLLSMEDDLTLADRQMAFNQMAAGHEMLQYFGYESTPYAYELKVSMPFTPLQL